MSKQTNQPKTYTTARGVTVEFNPLSPFEMKEIHELVPEPLLPTRRLETAVEGYTEEEPLAEDDLQSDEERRQWRAYVRARQLAAEERSALTLKYIFVEGLKFEQGNMEAWLAKRRRWNLPIPEDEVELLALYAQTEVIGSAEDVEKITEGVMGQQGVDEATLKAVRATFQRPVQREAVGRAGSAQGEVDLQPAHGGNEGGEGVGRAAAHAVL